MDRFMEIVGWVVCALIIGASFGLYDMRVCIKEVGMCETASKAGDGKGGAT